MNQTSIQENPTESQVPVWSFDAKRNLDRPFHGLITDFGSDIIMDLDTVVNETPMSSPVYMTKVFRKFAEQCGRGAETMSVMQKIAGVMGPRMNTLDDIAMVPPEAVFAGFARPRV